MVRQFVRFLFCSVFHLLFFLLSRVNVQGKENIRKHGGYITAANHLSVIEVPLVYCLLNRDDTSGLVAKKHRNNPFFRLMVSGSPQGAGVNLLPVEPNPSDHADHQSKKGIVPMLFCNQT